MLLKKEEIESIENIEVIVRNKGRKKRVCPICGGDGWDASPTRVEACRICHGKGKIW